MAKIHLFISDLFSYVVWDWVYLVRRPLFGLMYQSRLIYNTEHGAVGGIRIGRGKWSTLSKPASVPLCLPRIPHDLNWDRNQWGTDVYWPELWHGLFQTIINRIYIRKNSTWTLLQVSIPNTKIITTSIPNSIIIGQAYMSSLLAVCCANQVLCFYADKQH
jgi:hypothetical protein